MLLISDGQNNNHAHPQLSDSASCGATEKITEERSNIGPVHFSETGDFCLGCDPGASVTLHFLL